MDYRDKLITIKKFKSLTNGHNNHDRSYHGYDHHRHHLNVDEGTLGG